MGLFCMLFPAAVFCSVRNRVLGIEYENTFNGFLSLLFEYFCGNAFINVIAILIRMAVSHASGNVFEELNMYSGFAVKYLLLALALAWTLPYVELILSKYWTLDYHFNLKLRCNKWNGKTKTNIVFVYAAIMALHHLIRLFDNCFWCDELVVVNAARRPWGDMLRYVAENGHSPFHYAFAWICVSVFGESGFVYHLSAALPYFITVILCATFVRKRFGNKASIILVTLTALLESAITYNLEVRMYAWCQAFIFAAYLLLYDFYKTKKGIYYLLIAVCSLGAVYSHYFALAGIGLMYLVLLIYTAKTKYRDVWKVFGSGGSVLVLLLPWLVFAKRTNGVVMSDYRIELDGWKECVAFIFHSKYSMLLLTLFFAALLVRLIYDLGIVKIKNNGDGKRILVLSLDSQNMRLEREWIWIISGLSAVFGTIMVSEVISALVYPIVLVRYLYPVYIIIWLLFAITISRYRFGELWMVLLVAGIFITCYPSYVNILKAEHVNRGRLESTLAATVPVIDESNFIYTDLAYFDWTTSDACYPGTPHGLFGSAEWWGPEQLPELDGNTEYWLFLGEPISEEVMVRLEDMDYEYELIVDYGFTGTGDAWIYKAVPKTLKEK